MDLDVFRGVVPFVAVVEERSFRRAAAKLGVSAAAVSKAIGVLEKEVGTSLLARGSREVTPTREGALFYESCRPALTGVVAARALVLGTKREPQGELVVSVPFVVALRVRHPRLTFRLIVSDRLARLGDDPIDVAVRVGPLASSSLVARRLCGTRLVVVASPAYLARAGTPSVTSDLATHDCVVWVAPHGKAHPWVFLSGPVEVTPRVVVDHAPSLVDAALAGLGVAQLFDYMVDTHVRSGALVQLFADDAAPGPLVHAVCAPDRRATPRVRAAFQAFADAFGVRA